MDNILETDCTIEHDGQTYASGGAHLLPCTDGKYRGVVYVKMIAQTTPAGLPWEHRATVTTWHGEHIADASFTDYQGNFCKMRRIGFTWQGIKFIGDFCPDWAEACKVRSTKPVLSSVDLAMEYIAVIDNI